MGEVDLYRGAMAEIDQGPLVGLVSSCTLLIEYLEAGAKGLEEAMAREFVPR
jgi:hypothetical protein